MKWRGFNEDHVGHDFGNDVPNWEILGSFLGPLGCTLDFPRCKYCKSCPYCWIGTGSTRTGRDELHDKCSFLFWVE